MRAWRSILIDWTPPTITDNDSKTTLKPEINWSTNDYKLANYNNKTLHAIFNGYDAEHIKLISSCVSTKDSFKPCLKAQVMLKVTNFSLSLLYLRIYICWKMSPFLIFTLSYMILLMNNFPLAKRFLKLLLLEKL